MASGQRAGRRTSIGSCSRISRPQQLQTQSQKCHTGIWGGHQLMAPKEINWCGGGDLNPHGIAPASTSS